MILVLIAWFLLIADVVMTYRAIDKYGYDVETNAIMRVLIEASDEAVAAITILYMVVILYCHNLDVIGFWGWVVILGLNGSIFIGNVVFYLKHYKR